MKTILTTRWIWFSALLAATASIGFVAVSWSNGAGRPSSLAAARSTHFDRMAPKYRVLERVATKRVVIPSVVPAGGVAVLGNEFVDGQQPVLMYLQLASATADTISESQASADALKFDNAPGLSVTNAVLATVTVASDVPPSDIPAPASGVIGRVAWVVTVSLPSPISVSDCLPTQTASSACTHSLTNDFVILDPVTGAFLESLDS